MRHAFHAAFAAVLLTSAAYADPPKLDIPAEVKPSQGYAIVEPKTDAVSVTYVALDGVYPFPAKLLADKRTFVLPTNGLKVGRYRYVAVAANKTGEQSFTEFVVPIGDTLPDPKPKPDTDPVDPLTAAVQSAYTADASATKVADKAALAAVYLATAEVVSDTPTAGHLFTIIKGASDARVKDRLKPVRAVFGAELAKTLPTDAASALTAEQKGETVKLLKRFASVLAEVK